MEQPEDPTQTILSDIQRSMNEGNAQNTLETILSINDTIKSPTKSSTCISNILKIHHTYLFTYTCEVCEGLNCERCEENGICDIHDCLKMNVLDKKLCEEFAEKEPKVRNFRVGLENSLQKFECQKRVLANKFDELLTKIKNFHSNFIRIIEEAKRKTERKLQWARAATFIKMEESKAMAQNRINDCRLAEDTIKALKPFFHNVYLIPIKTLVLQNTDKTVQKIFDFEGFYHANIKIDFKGDESEVEKAVEKLYGVLEGINSYETVRNVENSNENYVEPMFLENSFNHEEISKAIEWEGEKNIKRMKMEYHFKFGEYGSDVGQFTEPSGVALGRNGNILIADANNHRIQVFDATGNFLKVIGQEQNTNDFNVKSMNEKDLVYPNRLAVNMATGDIYVTERSPTHQVRVYNEEGRFIRKFGSKVLQHPRGISVDKMGRIVVVECKVMRVAIFNSSGSLLNRFLILKKVNFPNSVVVNDKEEIFITDNRRHGVVVYDYHGAFLRNIGGIGLTNYPIGVGINSLGQLIVTDNHNNFNVTIFSQDGKLIRATESRVKHAQCFDIALMGESSIVLSSKDFRIFIYDYSENTNNY